jgi:hypothetical protein
VNKTVGSAGTPASMQWNITPANYTFSNTCPLLVHYEATNNIGPSFTKLSFILLSNSNGTSTCYQHVEVPFEFDNNRTFLLK